MGETAGAGVTTGEAALGATATTTGLVGAGATDMDAGGFVGTGLRTAVLVIANATRGAGFVRALGTVIAFVGATACTEGAAFVGTDFGRSPSCVSN